MEWGLREELRDCLVAAAPYGGPIGTGGVPEGVGGTGGVPPAEGPPVVARSSAPEQRPQGEVSRCPPATGHLLGLGAAPRQHPGEGGSGPAPGGGNGASAPPGVPGGAARERCVRGAPGAGYRGRGIGTGTGSPPGLGEGLWERCWGPGSTAPPVPLHGAGADTGGAALVSGCCGDGGHTSRRDIPVGCPQPCSSVSGAVPAVEERPGGAAGLDGRRGPAVHPGGRHRAHLRPLLRVQAPLQHGQRE